MVPTNFMEAQMKKASPLALILTSLLCTSAFAWELSDVSVLVPMPKTAQETNTLLTLSSAGRYGALTPDAIVDRLPLLVHNRDKNKTYKSDLRALGFRFDPCFTEGVGPQACRRQIRIVWQPITMSKGALVTLDSPVHTFYDFDEASWNELMTDYRGLLDATPPSGGPATLGVNPRLSKQGLGGTFHAAFKKLILKYCGAKNLSRLTLMSLHPGDNEWHFMGFDIQDGKMLPITIAGINTIQQVLKTLKPEGFDLLATVSPEGFSRTASAIYKNSLKAKKTLSEQEIQNFAEDLLTIENPRKSNPGTVDCASCHLAGPGMQWARLNFPKWDWKGMVARSGWSTDRDVTNTTLEFLKPRRLRAFGFFYADPLISQRTVNESAEVVEALEQSFPLRGK